MNLVKIITVVIYGPSENESTTLASLFDRTNQTVILSIDAVREDSFDCFSESDLEELHDQAVRHYIDADLGTAPAEIRTTRVHR